MRVNFKKLRKIPVETESGVNLGRVVDVELDAEKHLVSKYFVAKTTFGVSKIFDAGQLSIAPNQIVSVSNEKIVVEDNVCREEKRVSADQQIPNVETSAVGNACARSSTKQ
ncbi:hypothetical protein HZB94_02080 [Candidatus Falkowbacteria bacterium]|nr:hypothetical protein [Candidatus Falkowbacteria bacterium]